MQRDMFKSSAKSEYKLRDEIAIKMSDGEVLCGRIFVGFNERPLDIFNDTRTFIPIEIEKNNQLVLVSKKHIAMIDTFESTAENASKFTNNVSNSILENTQYHHKNSNDTDNNQKQETLNDNETMKDDCLKLLSILESTMFQERRNVDIEFDRNVSHIIKYFQHKMQK